MDDKFKNVDYIETAPDAIEQVVIDEYVQGRPWVLISAYIPDSTNDLGFHIEAGLGVTIDDIEMFLEKSLMAFRQGRESN